MGLGDLVSKVLVEFKGDTSDLKAKLKDLSGIEKERTKALIDDIERQNKGYESAITKLGHLGLAMDTVGRAVDAARDALKSYGEHLRLETATAGVNVGKLSDAFGGLVTQHDLMTMAAQTSTGVLKLNQGQMETLGQAALALKNRGYDLGESIKKLTDAAVKGKVEGLDDLGLSIKSGASNAETLKNLMTELNKVIKDGSTAANDQADAVQRLGVQWDNASSKVKHYAAEAILAASVDISPESLKKMAIDNGWKNFRALFPDDSWAKTQSAFATGMNKGRQTVLDSQVIEMGEMNVGRSDAERKKMAEEAVARAATAILRAAVASTERNIAGAGLSGGLGMAADSTIRNEFGNADSSFDTQAILDRLEGDRTGALTGDFKNRLAAQRAKKTAFLESAFGPIEEFNAYAAAFGMLSGAVTTSMSAWIDGSMSAGQALKKFFADALKGLASQMAVESLKHGAYAIGSLAFGDVRGAGQHAAAAAAFGAGAIAAGVAAKSLGGGGAPAPKVAGAGGGGASASGGNESSGTGQGKSGGNIFYISYGDAFADDSPRNRRLKAEQVVRKALGGSGGEDS